jgi:phosphoribosylglycinamide formyltransferase 1
MSDRWAVFLSGRGSTAQALFDMSDQVDVRWVVSNRCAAFGLKRAARLGLPTTVLAPGFSWQEVHQGLLDRRINRIFLLGFMKLIPADFLAKWQGRIWNVHPSLLPAYPGLKAMEKSFAEAQPMGVTIHDVVAEMDAGPRRLRKRVCDPGEWSSFAQAQLAMALSEQRLIRHWGGRIPPCRRGGLGRGGHSVA